MRIINMYLYDNERIHGFIAAGYYLSRKNPKRWDFLIARDESYVSYFVLDRITYKEWRMTMKLKNFLLPKLFKENR